MILNIENDIRLICAKAKSFPTGVLDAFKTIEKSHPDFCKRTFYGLSCGNAQGGIDYWAAVEYKNGDQVPQHLETKNVRKGIYEGELIENFRSHTPAIGETFQQLLKHPKLDRNSFCVEKYLEENVICMVKLSE